MEVARIETNEVGEMCMSAAVANADYCGTLIVVHAV